MINCITKSVVSVETQTMPVIADDVASQPSSVSSVCTVTKCTPGDVTGLKSVSQDTRKLVIENFVAKLRMFQMLIKNMFQLVLIKMKCKNTDLYVIMLYDLVMLVYTAQIFLISEQVTFDVLYVEFMVRHVTL